MKLSCFLIFTISILGLCNVALAQIDTAELVQNSKSENIVERQEANLQLAELYSEDSLKRELFLSRVLVETESLADSTYLKLFNKKVKFLSQIYRHSDAKRVAWKALVRGKKNNDTLLLANCHKHLSASSYKIYDYDSTNFHLQQAITYYEALGDSDNLGLMVLRKGGVQYSLGNYAEAMRLAFKASEIFKKIDEKKQLALAYMHLGNIYYFLRNYDESSKYYALSSDYYDLSGDSIGRAHAISNLSLTKIEQDSFEVSLKLQREVFPLILQSGREISIGNSYHYFTQAFFGLGELDSAEFYLKKSMQSNLKTGYVVGQSYDNLMKAKIESERGEIDSSLYYAEKAYDLIDTITNYEAESEVTYFLSEIYAKKRNYSKSYDLLKRHSLIRDSLDFDASSIERLAYDKQSKLERTEYELKLAKQKELLNSEEKHNQQLLIIVLSILAVIFIFFVGVLSSANRQNKRLNRELQLKQELIENELDNKRALLKEIHHRVKNNLQIISSMLSIQSQYISNEQLDHIIKECRSRIVSMSLIHESLYKREDEESALFSSYIKDLMPQLIDTYHIDETKIHLEMDIDDIELSLDDSVPCGLIINEVVSNSLKHAFPNGKAGIIKVEMYKKKDHIHLNISDNGVGFPEGMLPDNQDTFGFLLIYTLVGQLEANMNIKTDNGVAYCISWESKDDKLLN
jgi:two-component sensor histidine kinase